MQEPGECLVFFNFRDGLDNQPNVLEELRRAEALVGRLLGMLLEVSNGFYEIIDSNVSDDASDSSYDDEYDTTLPTVICDDSDDDQ